ILDPGPLKVEFELAGARVYTLGMPRRVPSPVGLLRLLKILHQSAPDLLQCWMYHGCLLGLMVGKLAGVRRILWRIGSANLEPESYPWVTRRVVNLCKRLSWLPDRIIFNSE